MKYIDQQSKSGFNRFVWLFILDKQKKRWAEIK